MDSKNSIANRPDLEGLSYDDFVGVMVKDSSGNATRVPYSQAKESGLVSSAQDLATAGARTAYRSKTGGFTRDIGNAVLDASVVLDKKTGKITVSAPKMILDDEAYKSVINPTLLKQLSSAHQRNENYKIPDPFDEGNEEKDITIPEAVEKYDKAIKELTAAMQEEIQTRDEISRGERGFSNRNDIANRLTRGDMIVMGTNAMGEGANDKSLIAIPKFLYADLDGNGLLTFDRDSGTIEKGEFRKKIFSLIEHNEDYVDSIYNKLEEYFEDDSFEDTEEYARATALYSFILNNDPDMTPAQVANYVTSNFFRGLGHGISTVSRNIGKAGDLLLGASIDYIEEEYKDDDKDYEEAQKFLSRMSSAGATALGIGDVAGTIIPDIALSMMGGNVAGAFAGAATKIKGAEAIVTAARAGEAAKTAETVAKEAEALTAGADLLIAANNTKRAAELGAAAAKLSQTAARTSTVVDLATQTIVEAVISDPVVFGKILQNQEANGEQAGTTQDAYGELLEIAAWNIGGWGAFTVGAKGLKSFGSTSAGRYTNAVAQKYLNKVPVYTGKLGEKILKARYGDEWLTSGSTRTGAARKGQARKYNYELRLAQENIAKQKLGSPFDKNVMSNVRKQEQNIVKLMNLQNSTDALQRGSTAYIRRKLDATINPVLSNYEQKLRKLGSDITKLERRAGLSKRRKVFRRGDKDVVRVFSKQSANYIGARTQLDVLRNIKRVKGSLTQAQEDGLAKLKKMLEDAKNALPKEIQEGLEAYIAWDRRFYKELNNLRMREGTLSERQIQELREEGYWGKDGELYRPSYRVDPNRETKLVRNDERVARDNDTVTEQYVWGSDKDFMDPEVARYMYMGDAGNVFNARQYIEAVSAIPSAKSHVIHDADEVARVQEMKDIKTPLKDRIKSVTTGVFKSGKISTGESAARALSLYKMRAEWVEQAGKVTDARLKLARASRNKIKVTVSDKRAAIGAMTQDQLDEIFAEAGITFNFSKMNSPEEFETFYNSLDKTTQKYLQQRMGDVAGILYPAENTSTLDIAIAKESERMRSASENVEGDVVKGLSLDDLVESYGSTGNNLFNLKNSEGEVDFGVFGVTPWKREKTVEDLKSRLSKLEDEWETKQAEKRSDWGKKMDSLVHEEFEASNNPEKLAEIKKQITEMEKTRPGLASSYDDPELNLIRAQIKKLEDPTYESFDIKNLVDSDNTMKFLTLGDSDDIRKMGFQYLTDGKMRRALFQKGYDNLTPKEKQQVDRADKAFTQRLSKDVVLYRGEPTNGGRTIKVGEPFDMSSWTYTSVYPRYTDDYSAGITSDAQNKSKDFGTIFRFHAKEGTPVYASTKGRYQNALNSSGAASEFVLPRDMKATIVGVTKDKTGLFSKKKVATIVDVELDPTTGVTPKLQPQKTSNLESVSMNDAPSLVKNAPYITAENYNKLARMDSSFVPGLKKILAQNRKDLRDSSLVTKGVEDAKRAQITAEREGLLKENLDELDKLTKEGLSNGDKDAILEEFDAGVDEYLDTIYKDKKLARSIDDIIEQSGTVDKEAAREYIALEELLRDDNKELAEIRKIAKDDMGKDPAKQNASDMFERMFEDKLAERRNIARQKLVDENSTLVDRKSWMKEIREADQQIRKDLAEPGYISIPNSRGEMEVWEVDPIAADLYNYSAKQPEMGAVAKFFNETSKIFRLGTTGLNITSFVNQSFRDFGNLWLTSGSYHMINFARADMVDMVGPEIARWYRREEPEVYKQLVELAERRGKSVEAMVVERELAIGRETSTQATETAMLKTVSDARTLNKISKGEMSITNDALDRVVDKLSALNERRERYFRNLVYTDSLNQALKRGYTMKEARIQAEFMMNNATTNFSRQMVHLQALQRTVPYLGAAVNGTKSFYRVLSIDPAGVMSRLVGGFVLPIMAFTGMALNDPVARKKYEQLNEYEKDNNIIISVNGSLVKIPIPQEIGSLVKPWQHLVEKMWESNRHDFWELMLNDALGISPMDITGFYDLDQDAMENPAVWDRFDNGIKQLVVGQMAPPPVKAAYMLATGQDPYTGKFIDTSYQYYDSESGEVITMDSSQSAFAQMLADNFGGSATVLGAVINALAGRTAGDILDVVTTAAQYVSTGGEEGSLTTLFERAGAEAAKPITVAEYDRTRTAWNREISALYREKTGILNSPRYKEIEEAINTETDQQKLKKLKAQRQDMLNDWYDKAKTAISKLQDNLGGTIDRYRMASLISLLNMYESTGGISGPGRAANEELYDEGRDEAIRALISMGANEAGDNSILGYVTRVKQNDGSEVTEVKFYKPLEILAMQNAWYGNASVSKAYVQELLEDGPIDYTKELKQVKKLRQQIYDKGKLSQSDYANINALELEWNARVMQAIAPYIERVTPESAVNDEEVMEYLDDIIFVPSEFKKDKRGYYVTNKSLGNGSANDAYIKNYIRYIFGVNDTGYESGKNYSGRQTLGGE